MYSNEFEIYFWQIFYYLLLVDDKCLLKMGSFICHIFSVFNVSQKIEIPFVLQFRRVANLYFLTISILSTTPIRYVNACQIQLVEDYLVTFKLNCDLWAKRVVTRGAHHLFSSPLFGSSIDCYLPGVGDSRCQVIKHFLIFIILSIC